MIPPRVLRDMERLASKLGAPVFAFPRFNEDWQQLIAIMLSSRTRDEVTIQAAKRLFSKFSDLRALADASEGEICSLIKPVGFFRQKAKRVKTLAKILLNRRGEVPEDLDALLRLPGIGRKTARVFQALKGQQVVGIDTHVRRVAYRLGIINCLTLPPEKVEQAIARQVPVEWLSKINRIFVGFGQVVCLSRSPKCALCPKSVKRFCTRYKQSSKHSRN